VNWPFKPRLSVSNPSAFPPFGNAQSAGHPTSTISLRYILGDPFRSFFRWIVMDQTPRRPVPNNTVYFFPFGVSVKPFFPCGDVRLSSGPGRLTAIGKPPHERAQGSPSFSRTIFALRVLNLILLQRGLSLVSLRKRNPLNPPPASYSFSGPFFLVHLLKKFKPTLSFPPCPMKHQALIELSETPLLLS